MLIAHKCAFTSLKTSIQKNLTFKIFLKIFINKGTLVNIAINFHTLKLKS